MESQEPKILFLSHAAADQEIAMWIKQVLEDAFPGLEVFVSSDPEDLPPGSPWIETVLSHLREASSVWVLTTERGLSRKWVWFEAGAGWYRANVLLACCVGKVRKGGLPAPYSLYQAVNIDDERDLRTTVERLARELNATPPRVDYPAIAMDLVRLNVRAEERAKAQSSPFAAEVSARVTDGMAKLRPHQVEAVRQLLLEGQLTDRRAIALIRTLVSGSMASVFYSIESETGFVRMVRAPTDHERRLGYEGPWEINPTLKPDIEAYFKKPR